MTIYLDNAATTKPDPEVVKAMFPENDSNFGNASSVHKSGTQAAKAVEKARKIIAAKINAEPDDIYFTSGGTESNNLVLKGIAFNNLRKNSPKNHIITTSIEHPSILNVVQWLEKFGFKTEYLPVDSVGFIDPDDLKKAIRKETFLVSIIHANNEIGTIEPISQIGRICREKKVIFLTDACQSFTKTDVDVKKQNLDMVTLNAHKIHGPKGVGALYIKKGIIIDPLLHGGEQESNLRAGTHNTPGIAGFGKAVEIANEHDVTFMSQLRDYSIEKLCNAIDDILINGSRGDKRLCNNINLIINGIKGKDLFTHLNKRDIMVSTGSACASTKLTPSSILTAIGLSPEIADGAIRISLSKWNTKDELDFVIDTIIEIVNQKRKK